MIETSTRQRGDVEDALRLRRGRAEHEQRERHRGHALRPEPRHERLLGGVHLAAAGERHEDRDRPRHEQREQRRSPTAAQPSANRPSSVRIAPNTRKTPSFTSSTTSSDCASKQSRDVGPPDAERDRRDEHGDEPVALGRQRRDAVRRERDAERVERLLVLADLVAQRAPARHQPRGDERDHETRWPAPTSTSWSTNSHQTKSSSPGRRRREGEHRGQRQAVVQARLEVERVPDQPRHARVGHDRGREDGIGGRQQRADAGTTRSSRGR